MRTSVALFFSQELFHDVGVTDWEGQGGLRRRVIASSWEATYDEASMVMTVQFDNGALYEYYGVPSDLWTSFIAAQPHPWSQVGYPRLVQGAIPYKRIG